MAVPTWVGFGTFQRSLTALSGLSYHASTTDGDLVILGVETGAQTLSAPAGWNAFPNSPQEVNATGTINDTKLHVFYRYYVAGDAVPTVSDTGQHQGACIWTFRGVATGTPYNTTAGGSDSSADTSIDCPSVTTTEDDCLILNLVSNNHADAAGDTTTKNTLISGWTNANLTSVTQRTQNGYGRGVSETGDAAQSGNLAIVTGILATAGSSGSTTGTATGSVMDAYLTIALRPATDDKSDGDTGSGADNQTAAAATFSENDPSSAAAEASTIAATLSENDPSSAASEASTIAATPATENDPSSAAVEASTLVVTPPTETDTGSGTDTENLVVNLSDGDIGTAADGGESIEGMDVNLDDDDTGTGTEGEGDFGITDVHDTASGAEDSTIVVTLSDSDTGSGAEDSSIVATFTDTDTGSGLDDNNAIDQTLSDGDTGTGVDDGSITSVLVTDGDTGSGVDAGAVPPATLSDDDPASLGDAESLDTGAPVVDRHFSITFGGRPTGVEEVARTTIPYCIAHRGGPDDYGPENLLSTVVEAVTAGASVEIDVRNSSQNTAWLMHDWDVARTTNGSGGVIEKTDSQLNALIADGTGGLEGIPTLLEVLNAVAGINSFSKVIIHYNAGDYTQTDIENIQDDIDASGMNSRVIFSSWLWEHLRDFELWGNPAIERMQILDTAEDWYPSEYQTSILVGNYADLTLQAVQEAQATGLVVHASVGSDQGYRKIMTTGVASNMTDAPEAYWTWLGKYQTGSV